MLQVLRTSWEKNLPQYRALALLRFPDFVYRSRINDIGNQMPIFVFHSLDPARFEAQLQYLTENGYRSLGADECVAVVAGRKPLSERTVVLTFEDGLRSLWSVIPCSGSLAMLLWLLWWRGLSPMESPGRRSRMFGLAERRVKR